MCLISIIVPVYNGEKYLTRSLDSLVKEKDPLVEIIVVNDGSTDSTNSILENYPEIKVVNKQNKGVSSARNLGIEYSNGEYLMFVDADDKLASETIVSLVETILLNKPDFICYRRQDVHGLLENVSIKNNDIVYYELGKDSYVEEYLSTTKHTFSVCNKVYKKSTIVNNNIRFEESLKLSEDALFNLVYFLYSGNKIIFDFRAVYFRYWNENSTIHKPISSYFSKNIVFIDRYKKILAQKGIAHKEYESVIENLYYATAKASLYRLYNCIDYSSANERIIEINKIINVKEVLNATATMKKHLALPSDKLVNRLIKLGNARLLYICLISIRKFRKILNV
ncbi:glycosyltransferase family 2 protein [Planococcus sp. ANT_H30]|uniref:glycosyltransferase family 2 protein n=1 Tax=Planococcus sp. ANT_H30 TaxID=2597347 RepID=UPI0011EC3A36|nr:glycosyltransferase family 2 protein [Planococcus sp. ANT_H30]KAA0958749.1 glycosyltransferase family 2 protein [Planococcus sp. ANT_H30]